MTTTDGYIRQIKHVLANDQHVVHNSPTVADLLREVADALDSEQRMKNHFVGLAARHEQSCIELLAVARLIVKAHPLNGNSNCETCVASRAAEAAIARIEAR